MSIFMGKQSLRMIYKEVNVSELNATDATIANQLLVYGLERQSKVLLVANNTNVDVVFMAVHPECGDSEINNAAFRLKLFEIPAGGALNFENAGISHLVLDGGTKLFIYKSSAIPAAAGKVRMISYG